MSSKKLQPTAAKMLQVEKAFFDHGYGELSMRGLAKACDFSTRALYYYFSSKEEAFRAAVRFRNELALSSCFAAGGRVRADGGDALDIVTEIINVRYGDTRRLAHTSRHLLELNAEVFKRCGDIVVEVALRFEAELARLLDELAAAGLLQFRADVNAAQLAEALANGARGVNQRLPAVAPDALAGRYREICRFILYGGAELARSPEGGKRRATDRKLENARN